MNENPHQTWDPAQPAVLADQISAYDQRRVGCPIAHSDYLGWSLFRHAEISRVLYDPDTFSNAVSTHLNVPNGMDPPEHTRYRTIVDRYFTTDLVDAFEPACRTIARDLVTGLSRDDVTEMMSAFAEDFALRVQSAYLGWSPQLHEPLRAWTKRNREATLTRDLAAMTAVAGEFDGYITALLDTRRTALDAPVDLTTRLLSELVEGEPLSDDEIVSILRNWTVGELATIAASAGIIAQYLAAHLDVQDQLRAEPTLLPAAIDEILRIHAPLVSNRRITTKSVQLGGQHLRAGERLTILWASANRDEAVFGDPDELRLDRDPTLTLLYGAGIHVCPGARLARLELRVLAEELLTGTRRLELVPNYDAVRAVFPGGGFATLPLLVH